MPFAATLNFRNTAGFVTDGAGQTYVLDTDGPGTSRNGLTFGWTVTGGAINGANRNAALDPRLAGINFVFGATATFTLTLPNTGQYQIGVALGDDGGAQTVNKVEILDNGSSLFSIGPHSTSAGQWYDASDTPRTSATWVSTGSTTFSTQTFGSTVFQAVITGAAGTLSCLIVNEVVSASGWGPLLGLGNNRLVNP